MAQTEWNQPILSHRSQVNNPIPANTKTIRDILPDTSGYQKLNNSPIISPNYKAKQYSNAKNYSPKSKRYIGK